MVEARQNDLKGPFTVISSSIFVKSTDIAAKVHSDEVKPIHMMLVILCGVSVNFDGLEQFLAPEEPSLLWSVLESLEPEVDPLKIAKAIKQSILPSSRPGGSANHPHGGHSGWHLIITFYGPFESDVGGERIDINASTFASASLEMDSLPFRDGGDFISHTNAREACSVIGEKFKGHDQFPWKVVLRMGQKALSFRRVYVSS
ncbi:hypothetical protein BJ138DRAFT_1184405 [Hygrophoropsis aurantiaca]|uniref:Uncharacterized protein n=1 Tax=Hygrophoropsis aurantiaca TaxID=72124 RepID=A0ACB7ZS02_9AGAM|nr:hypothetical protein BJ138DRAFT_1184405 [Hygrophoropsis aurantiaca]